MEEKQAVAAPRALALDALRGLAIVGMCLSGRVPFNSELALPSWMYHAQYPLPNPGYTWVDLVFPLFLFSMGVAFPFALSSRIRKGISYSRICLGIAVRTVSLGAFAIYFQHVNPWLINVDATMASLRSAVGFAPSFLANNYTLAFIGFLLMFPLYTRLPQSWPAWVGWTIRAVGLLLVVGFLSVLKQGSEAKGFSVTRSNIILVVLTNMVLFGSLIWLLSQKSLGLRLGFVLVGLAAHFSKYDWMPLREWLTWTPLPWMYQFAYLKYLCIVVPGTIIGDGLLTWMRESKKGGDGKPAWTSAQLLGLSMLLTAVVIGVHTGLQSRAVLMTLVASAAFLAVGLPLVKDPRSGAERLLRSWYIWGTVWLLIGLLIEPYEGGIKKDPSTPSYYFTSLGLSILCLMAFMVWIDLFGKRRWFGLLILTGQNPMLAYLGINNLMEPFLALFGAPKITTPTAAGLWAGFKTVVHAALTSVFTKLGITWKT